MKLMHLADLHLGKRVNGFSMMEDQEYILNRILEIMEEEQPDGLLIAGDVYDKTIPPAEAVRRMDDFLTAVAAKHVPVFLISGNHDSAERVAFGHQLMQGSGIWISPVYDGTIRHHTLEDRWGEVNIYLIPFLRPSVVRSFFISSSRRRGHCRKPATRNSCRWAVWTGWTEVFLAPSIIPLWGTSTVRSAWEARRFGTPDPL